MNHAKSTSDLRGTTLEHLLGKQANAGTDISDLAKIGKAAHAQLALLIQEGVSGDIELELTEQTPCGLADWISTLGEHSPLILLMMTDDGEAVGALATELQTLGLMTNAAFGGDPALAQPRDERPLSAVESGFLTVLGKLAASTMREFGYDCPLNLQVVPAEEIDKSVLSSSEAIILTFSVSVGTAFGRLELASSIEKLQKSKTSSSISRAEPTWKTHLSKEISNTRIKIEVVVDLSEQTLGKLKKLRVGDVLDIPAGNLGKSKLVARGEPIFNGRIGRLGDTYSVLISGRARSSSGILDSIAKGIDGHTNTSRNKKV